jgi:hypothetical protein
MRPARGSGGADTSRAFRAASRLTTWWVHRYTRSVDPRIAEDRESEVEFELWEFGIAAEQHRWSAPHAAMTLALHTVSGMPRDRAWRSMALREWRTPAAAPVRLLSRRQRTRVWIPLQQGHVFDQTNGVIEPEKAMPHERSRGSWGAAGNAFGIQGGF